MNKTSTKKVGTPINTKKNDRIGNKKEIPYELGNNVIDTILNYSKSLSIRPSKNGGHFEIVLN